MEKFHTLKCLQQEAVRMKTFRGWPSNGIRPEDLVKAGFYYLHFKDYTQCFFCRGVVGAWEAADVPLDEHRMHFPNCPFLKSPDDAGNIPMTLPNEPIHHTSKLSCLMFEFLNFKLQYHKPPYLKQTTATSGERTAASYSMRWPHYANPKTREDSFLSGREGVFPAHIAMVKAGFFYSGVSDFVVCFYCGGGLYNWNASDDPWMQHAQAYPYCTHLAHNKGMWQPQPQHQSVPFRSPKLSEEEKGILMSAPIAKKLLRCGFDNHLVQCALVELMEERAVLPVTEDEASELVSKYANKHHMDVDKIRQELLQSDNIEETGRPNKPPGEPRENTHLFSIPSNPRDSGRNVTEPQLFYNSAPQHGLNSNTVADERRSFGDLFSKGQSIISGATAIRSGAGQVLLPTMHNSAQQGLSPSDFGGELSAGALGTSAVKVEVLEVDVIGSTSPNPVFPRPILPYESQSWTNPFSSTSRSGRRTTSPMEAQHSAYMSDIGPESISQRGNQLNYTAAEKNSSSLCLQREVGSTSQQTSNNERIRELQLELQALQNSQQLQFQQSQYASMGPVRHEVGRAITETEIRDLASRVMEKRRRVRAVQRRYACRSCGGASPATVMVLPCNHLNLCNLCAMANPSCPTCAGPIRGTVMPIRGVLIT